LNEDKGLTFANLQGGQKSKPLTNNINKSYEKNPPTKLDCESNLSVKKAQEQYKLVLHSLCVT